MIEKKKNATLNLVYTFRVEFWVQLDNVFTPNQFVSV